jgi:predicted ATPase
VIFKSIAISNFLSIRGTISFDIDSNVSILLGANDHGKSNILAAIEHLNEGSVITAEEVNWDADESGSETEISWTFKFTGLEVANLKTWVTTTIEALAGETKVVYARDGITEQEAPVEVVDHSSDGVLIGDRSVVQISATAAIEELEAFRKELEGDDIFIIVKRSGVDSERRITWEPGFGLVDSLFDFIVKQLPRVELIKNLSEGIQDTTTIEEITTDRFEFLQGIFYYADLDPFKCGNLFRQTDTTERALDAASAVLDRELRRLWAQGAELGIHFELRHREGAIELRANDPSVRARKTRLSKRGTGVTQFFRISMMLHARRKKHPANSYIYLFDEPGVYLHPRGQQDLMQVFEQLSSQAQVVYSTHSLFLINRNFPERHRLVVRNEAGTMIDQKPYRANWRLATDALGVYLTSNILFSTSVLLVEGDSDPIYIYDFLRGYNKSEEIDADANALGVFSFSDQSNLKFLLQIFKRDRPEAKVLVLLDGDKAGKAMAKSVKSLCERLEVPLIRLEDGASIEDYLLSETVLIDAVTTTIKHALEAEQIAIPTDLPTEIGEKRNEHRVAANSTTGKWFKDTAKHYLGDEASKVALARNYVFALRENPETPIDNPKATRTLELCRDIVEKLGLPERRAQMTIETAPVAN